MCGALPLGLLRQSWTVCHGVPRHGELGQSRCGTFGSGEARRGKCWCGLAVLARLGLLRQCEAWSGPARWGTAVVASYGAERPVMISLGKVLQSRHSQVGPGMLGSGASWRGKAGYARQGWSS